MITDSNLVIRKADKDDIPAIRKLAHEIWPHTYGKILSEDQLKYMLRLFYSDEVLLEQIDNQHSFLIAEINSEPVAFAAYSKDYSDDVYKIHKIYVHQKTQGKGLGKKLIDKIIVEVKKSAAFALRLNVNRHNSARSFYEKLGFNIIGEEDIDIGGGYFMNDYIMEKKI